MLAKCSPKGLVYSLNQKENVFIFRFIESDLNFGLGHLTWERKDNRNINGKGDGNRDRKLKHNKKGRHKELVTTSSTTIPQQ